MKCPVCGNMNDFTYIESRNNPETGLKYEIFSCLNCLSEFCEPMQAAPPEWYIHRGEYYGWRWEFTQALKDIRRLIPKGKKLLEIGCGEGVLLEKLKEHHNVYGIDFNEKAIEKAKTKELNAYSLTVEEFILRFPELKFDGILFFHLLEHLPDPFEFLLKIRSILNGKGFIFISIPNPNRISLVLKREDWDYPPHHLIRFSVEGIKKFLNWTGFRIVKIKQQPKDLPLVHITSTVELDKFIKRKFHVDILRFNKTLRNILRLPFFVPFNVLNFFTVLKTIIKHIDKKGTALYVIAQKGA